jgi:hypothetical protein
MQIRVIIRNTSHTIDNIQYDCPVRADVNKNGTCSALLSILAMSCVVYDEKIVSYFPPLSCSI